MLAARQAKAKSQLRAIAKMQRLLPILFAEPYERRKVGRGKPQRCQDRVDVRRNE